MARDIGDPMKPSLCLPRLALMWLLVCLAFPALARKDKADDPLAGTVEEAGFVDVHRDADGGRVLVGVHALDTPFLMVSSLPGGLGSNDVGLDRSQFGRARLVEFRRAGPRLLLVEKNTRFTAATDDALERRATADAFAESVLWSAPLIAPGKQGDGPWIIDLSPLLLTDRHGVVATLRDTGQGEHQLDAERSAVLVESARSFPDNSEFESLLTLTGPGTGGFVKDVAMDAQVFTLRQRISFVRLPDAGFVPRKYHPASGAWSVGAVDFAQPLEAPLAQSLQPRFRLEKLDPTAPRSRVKKPIVFYLDPGTPEPMRSALIEGANWWKDAFDAAGFIDAYRVELLPADADPLDIRYNMISWTHRATRGWSYGYGMADPRTGEIIKGQVLLGSQRVRHDLLIAESLLAPFGKPNEAALRSEAREMALARLRQLSAHEVGHALGFLHNFNASRHGNGSVMDYPHPVIGLDGDDGISLANAYGVGIGEWDRYLVAHGYGQFADEASALAALRREIFAKGYGYVEDAQARQPSDAHPDALLWDYGADSLKTFAQLMEVRQRALANFSAAVLPPDRPAGEIEARLVPIYLLHRYQSEAVARLIGGESYTPGLAGDGAFGMTPVPGAKQSAAIAALVGALEVDQLALPAHVLALMTPPPADSKRSREYFSPRAGEMFDPSAAIGAATALQSQLLFDPARLNRLEWQRARDASAPSATALIRQVLKATWHTTPAGESAASATAWARNWVLLDALMLVAGDARLQPAVAAQVRGEISKLEAFARTAKAGGGVGAAQFADAERRIAAWLQDPVANPPRPLPTVPPGAPI